MTIDLRNTYKYYKNLSHQNEAIENLEEEIIKTNPSLLQNFAEIWRKENDAPINVSDTASSNPLQLITNRLKKLGLRPDSDYLDKTGRKDNYRLTIVGIEGVNTDFTLNDDRPDKFNDIVLGMRLYGDGSIDMTKPFLCTTEPGRHYTRYAMNKKGAARVCIDEKHEDIWKLGRHFREPDCLVQTGNTIRVSRDYNKDYSRIGDKIDKGYFGINFHHGWNSSEKGSIGKTSAGCLVIPSKVKFYSFINDYVKNDVAYKKLGKEAKFSYILLDGSKIF